jgi:hypothetical protein
MVLDLIRPEAKAHGVNEIELDAGVFVFASQLFSPLFKRVSPIPTNIIDHLFPPQRPHFTPR